MQAPEEAWAFEVVSRFHFDPGNHGKKKCLITSDELQRRYGPPENLGCSIQPTVALLKLGKNSNVKKFVEQFIQEMDSLYHMVDFDDTYTKSAFTLVAEGKLLSQF